MPENTKDAALNQNLGQARQTAGTQKSEQPINNVSIEQATVAGSKLLGMYNSNGEYIIAPAILKELYEVDKLKKTTFKNSVFCTSYMPNYGDLTFEIVYEKNSQNKTAKATMYILEKDYKVNGYLQNTIKTKVGEYIASLDDFVQNSYNEFNVNVAPVGSGKVYNVKDDEKLQGYIMAKQLFNSLLTEFSADDCLVVYEEFFTQRLQLLNQLNSEFSKEVLARFNKEYAKIEKYFLNAKDYKALSELLDKCIEDVSGINPKWIDQEKEYKEKILPIILIFVDQMNEVVEKAGQKARGMLRRRDREKLDEIAAQEKSALVPQSNTGKMRPDKIKPLIKVDLKAKAVGTLERLTKLQEKVTQEKKPESLAKTSVTEVKEHIQKTQDDNVEKVLQTNSNDSVTPVKKRESQYVREITSEKIISLTERHNNVNPKNNADKVNRADSGRLL